MKQDNAIRRKYPRKSFRKAVSLMFDGHSSVAHGIDIGEGGLSFSTEEKITPPKKIIVNFFLSDKDFFSVRISLLNSFKQSDGYTYGASFDDVSIALKRQIRAYVARTTEF
ncbi:MAG: PilZ domain-containing protein [Pseudobdellovibrio sp.]